MDGASSWKRFWKISFPLLTPYIFYNLVVGLINSLQIFEPIFVLYRDNQPLVPSAISMVYYLWQASFRLLDHLHHHPDRDRHPVQDAGPLGSLRSVLVPQPYENVYLLRKLSLSERQLALPHPIVAVLGDHYA